MASGHFGGQACRPEGVRRSSWPPSSLARPPNTVLLEITDPLFERQEVEEDGDSLLLPGKVAIVPEPER